MQLPVCSLLVVSLLMFGCSGDDPGSSTTCVPGTARACMCDPQRSGAESCNRFGAYDPCQCAGQTGGTGGDSGTSGSGGTGGIAGSAGTSGTGGIAGSAGTSGTGGIAGSAGTSGSGGTAGEGGTGVTGPIIVEPQDDAAYLFDQNQIRTYDIRIAQSDLDALNADPVAEQYVPGTLMFEGQEYGPVGVRYKGSVGAFYSCVQNGGLNPSGPKTCRKLSIKVSFNWTDPEGRFFGVKKLNFHSMNADASQMRDRLGYWLFRQMGVPAPRAVHAKVLFNGQTEGLFALVEQVDGRFTRSRFNEGGEGNLYKEVWPMHTTEQPYINALETNEDENPSAAKILSFANALRAADNNGLQAVIDARMNRDITLSYVAIDRTIANDDGAFHFYCNLPQGQGNNPGNVGNHNYYIYEEGTSDQLWVIPWDMDLSFLGETGLTRINTMWNDTNAVCFCLGQLAPSCDRLVRGWATMTADYNARRRALLDGPFSATRVDAQLNAWTAQLMSTVADIATADARQPSLAAWQNGLNSLRSSITTLRSTAEGQTP